MPGVSLRSLIGQKSASMQVVRALCGSLTAEVCIVDPSGRCFLGELPGDSFECRPRYPIVAGESEIGMRDWRRSAIIGFCKAALASGGARIGTARAGF